LNKENKNFIQYFSNFDEDHDLNLTPKEMRKALLAIPDKRFSLNQIERVLHIIYDRNKGKLINIEKAT